MKGRRVLASIIALVLIVGGFGYYIHRLNSESELNTRGEGSLKVVTTTTMVTDLVSIIGEGALEVKGLMGSGIDPHSYQATEGDVKSLQEADVIFHNGLHLEGKMDDLFTEMAKRDIPTFAITNSISNSKLLEGEDEFEGSYDPHIWFDVRLWKDATLYVRDILIEKDPENSEIYSSNADKYINELDELHQYVIDKAATIPREKRVLITAHDAFRYFGEAYGFEVLGLQGISTETEASISDVRELADLIAEREIPAIFIESSVPTRNIEALKAAVVSRGFDVEIGGELFSDAMGDLGEPEGTYLGMVRYNIDTIANALSR